MPPRPLKHPSSPSLIPPAIYRMRVALMESSPLIWRRIEVADKMTLARLHDVLQIVMGWEDYHLHAFTVHGRRYAKPEFEEDPEEEIFDERTAKLKQVLAGEIGIRLRYEYDFGDCWQHELLLEAVLLSDADTAYPCCTAGERRGPPEDVGGIPGYEHYVESMADPSAEDHQDLLDWRGPFDPEVFSLEEVNAQLRKRFRVPRKRAAAPSLPSATADAVSESPARKLALALTGRECELLREDSLAPGELIDRLQPGPAGTTRRAKFLYSAEELDELIGFVAASANHAENRKMEKEWDALFDRITALLNKTVSAG